MTRKVKHMPFEARGFGSGSITTTLCGRAGSYELGGYLNIAVNEIGKAEEDKVSCKFCQKIMQDKNHYRYKMQVK